MFFLCSFFVSIESLQEHQSENDDVFHDGFVKDGFDDELVKYVFSEV